MADEPLITNYCDIWAYNKAFNENDESETANWLNAFGDAFKIISATLGGAATVPGQASGKLGGYLGAAAAAINNGFSIPGLIIAGATVLATGALVAPIAAGAAFAAGLAGASTATAAGIGAFAGAVAGYFAGGVVLDVVNELHCNPNLLSDPYQLDLSFSFDRAISSPLVLDINADGKIDLINLKNSSAFFDLDGDHYAERTGWVGPNDGLLVHDWNGDGVINDIFELFGNNVKQGEESGFVEDGFVALKGYDTNRDNVFNSSDANFSKVRVWTDANQNGYSESSELKTLNSLGITSINLNATEVFIEDNGNEITDISTFSRSNGTTGQIIDAWLKHDQAVSFYIPDAPFSYNPGVFKLPQVVGSGDYMDLWKAMSLDATLRQQVQTLVTQNFTNFNFANFVNQVEPIVLRWFGVDGISPSARGANINAQHLEGLETIMGREFKVFGTVANPTELQGNSLESAWNSWINITALKILIQIPTLSYSEASYNGYKALENFYKTNGVNANLSDTQLKTLLDPIFNSAKQKAVAHPLYDKFNFIGYNFLTDGLEGNALEFLKASISSAPTTASALPSYWASKLPIFDALIKSEGLISSVNGIDKSSVIAGTTGNDSLVGTAADEFIYGGAGNDVIKAGEGQDFLYGGAGNDTLVGQGEGDVYLWGTGEGTDRVQNDNMGQSFFDSRIIFGKDITPQNLTFSRSGNDLVFAVNGYTDKLIINEGLGDYWNWVELFVFEFGDTITNEYIQSQLLQSTAGADFIKGFYTSESINGGDGNDTIFGLQGDDTLLGGNGNDLIISSSYWTSSISGGAGNDLIYGFGGLDTLAGGTGNDFLKGGEESDLYKINQSEGIDVIEDTYGSGDALSFGSGITYSALTYEKLDDDFGIIINATNKVFLNNQFSSSLLEKIQFSDGTNLTWEQIHQNFLDKAATAGSDYITGHSLNETVKGAAGNDYLLAARGNDTYRINQNEGHDVISDSSGTDTILFGSGISKSNIQFGKIDNLLVIHLPGGTKVYVDRQFVSTQQIESFNFSDGSSYTAAEVLSLIQNQSSNNQTLNGTSVANTINGGLGDDTLRGSSGGDSYDYILGDGNDIIYDSGSASDVDKLVLGTGLLSSNLVMTTTLEDIDDVILSFKGSSGSILLDEQWFSDARYGIDQITFGNGEIWNRATFQSKFLQGQITTANDVVFGLSTNDTILSGTGNDRVSGLKGNDSISGEAGSDTVVGDDGNDTINGGTEDDYLLGGSNNDSILGGAGADRLFGESNDDIIFGNDDGDYIDGGSGIDTVNGDNGNDTLVGGSGNDIISGLANDDYLFGGFDNDKLSGNLGNDTLYGESGSDTLEGNEENDVLFGGAGVDVLTGGAGKDYFVFQSTSDSSTSSPDRITDFVRGTDKIIFEDGYFTGIRSGAASGNILGYAYDSATNLTVIKDAASSLRVELVGNVALSKGDFYFGEDLFDHL